MAEPPERLTKRTPVVGLLGAPGSGKSTIAGMFAALGCAVIDADQLAREAFEDPAIRDTLVGWWGGEVAPAGTVDRKRVGAIVFDDAEQRQRLEGLVHPYVNHQRQERRRLLQRQGSESVRAIIEDCPLLLETGLDRECDALVFVDCPLDERQARVLASRGWSAEQLAARDAAQMPLDTKRARADYTIANVGDEQAIQRRVQDVLQDILQA